MLIQVRVDKSSYFNLEGKKPTIIHIEEMIKMYIYPQDYLELTTGELVTFIQEKCGSKILVKNTNNKLIVRNLNQIKRKIDKEEWESLQPNNIKENNTMKVRITNGLFKGSEGVIQKLEDMNLVEIKGEKSVVIVPMDREFLEVISGPIEKEESPRKRDKFFMVWRSQGSSPNKKHETYEAAQEEAKRLVKNNPNVTFYVLEALDEIKAEVEIKEKKLG